MLGVINMIFLYCVSTRLCKYFSFRRTFAPPVYPLECVAIFEDEIVITKLLNMLIWSLLSPGRCWISCKTLNLIFSKTNFWPTGLYVLSSISKILHNFSTGFFSMYRGILELKNDNRILRKKMAQSQIRPVTAWLYCF